MLDRQVVSLDDLRMRNEKFNELHKKMEMNSELAESENTKRCYDSDWRMFEEWCNQYNIPTLPASPEHICYYIIDKAESYTYSTLERKLSSIARMHTKSGYDSPTSNDLVRKNMKTISNEKGTKQNGKNPLYYSELKLVINAIDNYNPSNSNEQVEYLTKLRNKLSILLQFSLACRISEMIRIEMKHITFTNDGIKIWVFEKKVGKQQEKYIKEREGEYCAVKALKKWLSATGIENGHVFRAIKRNGLIGDKLGKGTVSKVIKQFAELAGLDAEKFASHSLRKGYAVEAHIHGKTLWEIQSYLGHSRSDMTYRYAKEEDERRGDMLSFMDE